MAEREQPVVAPKPLFDCLPAAVRVAIAHGTPIGAVNFERWGRTYNATAQEVREVWTHELTKIPPDAICEGSDGK